MYLLLGFVSLQMVEVQLLHSVNVNYNVAGGKGTAEREIGMRVYWRDISMRRVLESGMCIKGAREMPVTTTRIVNLFQLISSVQQLR